MHMGRPTARAATRTPECGGKPDLYLAWEPYLYLATNLRTTSGLYEPLKPTRTVSCCIYLSYVCHTRVPPAHSNYSDTCCAAMNRLASCCHRREHCCGAPTFPPRPRKSSEDLATSMNSRGSAVTLSRFESASRNAGGDICATSRSKKCVTKSRITARSMFLVRTPISTAASTIASSSDSANPM